MLAKNSMVTITKDVSWKFLLRRDIQGRLDETRRRCFAWMMDEDDEIFGYRLCTVPVTFLASYISHISAWIRFGVRCIFACFLSHAVFLLAVLLWRFWRLLSKRLSVKVAKHEKYHHVKPTKAPWWVPMNGINKHLQKLSATVSWPPGRSGFKKGKLSMHPWAPELQIHWWLQVLRLLRFLGFVWKS